ncbi:MAG: 3'-5' exonuclease [Chlorobi bacterium]|nr:3'-5' exonuclease [Chlorobiota bacterium]MCI0716570.1 3'-5' exonuclease [Chlorobiota bacterium]
MLERINLKNVLVIDIETVPQYASYFELPEPWKELWKKKMQRELKEGLSPEGLYQRAGIFAEFGKIICICAGYFYDNGDGLSFKVKAFYGDDEKKILAEFCETLNKSFSTDEHMLCGHNSREFDFPYIARRCLVNGVEIPHLLNNSGKKPWEVQLLDTMDMWKFGDYKSFTSLNLLAEVFGIESPKNDIDGSVVWSTYWIEKDLERIKNYCMKDVVTVAQLLLKFKGLELLKEENISFTN